MALGNSVEREDESPIVIAVSAVAVSIVLVVLTMIAVMRARHFRMQEAARIQREYETNLALWLGDEPRIADVWLLRQDTGSLEGWNSVMVS